MLFWTEIAREVADAAGGAVEDNAAGAVDAGAVANAADAGAKGSIYDDLGVDEPGKEGSTTWPEDWRKQMAGEDAKALKTLERYTSPDAVAKALLSAQQRIRSGEYKRQISADASPEELKAWREEQGLPSDAKEYEIPMLLDGSYDDLDDFGKESVDAFREVFYESNLPPSVAAKIMETGNKIAEQQLERQAQADAQRHEQAEDLLRSEWGGDFRRNIALNAQFLQDKFGDDWSSLIMARTPDGTRLADMPEFNKFVNQMARSEGGTVLESGEVVAGANSAARIAEIEKIMSSDYGRYKREGLDSEYAKLLEARR